MTTVADLIARAYPAPRTADPREILSFEGAVLGIRALVRDLNLDDLAALLDALYASQRHATPHEAIAWVRGELLRGGRWEDVRAAVHNDG